MKSVLIGIDLSMRVFHHQFSSPVPRSEEPNLMVVEVSDQDTGARAMY